MDMPGAAADLNSTLARLVDSTSDGVVVTDPSGRILVANPAFLSLVQSTNEAAVKGRPLMDWIGVSDSQLVDIIARVRRQGVTRRMSSYLMSSDAQVSEVEVSAALLTEGDQECIGFTIHYVAPRQGSVQSLERLMSAVEGLTARIGGIALPELLQETVHLAQQHFVRAALQRCGNDPVLAAGLLGVSADELKHAEALGGIPGVGQAPRAAG